jgi:hypothetical protein
MTIPDYAAFGVLNVAAVFADRKQRVAPVPPVR